MDLYEVWVAKKRRNGLVYHKTAEERNLRLALLAASNRGPGRFLIWHGQNCVARLHLRPVSVPSPRPA